MQTIKKQSGERSKQAMEAGISENVVGKLCTNNPPVR